MSALAPITVAEVTPTQPITTPDAPLIGVVVPLNFPDLTDESRALVVRFTRTALATLTELGARLLVIDPTAEKPAPLDGAVDGLLLLGGGDVDPSLYGHHANVPNLYGVDRRCDERTLEAIRSALANQLPIFGICRGAQMLNLAHGGTLIPDLGPTPPTTGTVRTHCSSTIPSTSNPAPDWPTSSEAPPPPWQRPPPGRRGRGPPTAGRRTRHRRNRRSHRASRPQHLVARGALASRGL